MNDELPPGGFLARKRPIVIAAVLVTLANLRDVAAWAGGVSVIAPDELASVDESVYGFDLATLEGVLRVRPGDYVLRGVEGEFYPCQTSIFEATYDVVEQP